ncbi:hypothetical protein ACHWQZ_G016401 [Mnemiopsis leidyi]
MYSVCRRLLQVRNYKTVRVSDGLSHLRDNHKREQQINLDKEYKEKRAERAAALRKMEEEKKKVNSTPPLVTFGLTCPGCGAKYQYQNPEKAGYVEHNTMMAWDTSSALPCERCERVSDSEIHQMYSISEKRFTSLLRKISQRRALGVVVCDVLSFPSSLPPNLPEVYPPGSPVILCLNKCDVLATSPGKMDIIQQYFGPLIEKWEKQNNFRFNEIIFASGKTGIGLPELALHIQLYVHGDKYCRDLDFCYLLGVTNAGKSTLFNKLSPLLNNKLKSIGNVTESPLPGTTVRDINSVIVPPPEITRHKKHATAQMLHRKVNKLEKLVAPSELPPDVEDTSVNAWFKSRIDQQLKGGTDEKMLIDTPGVLADNTIPESVFACQHKIYKRGVELEPGSCLSFGWYKVFYARGSVSLKLDVNVPSVVKHEIISEVSDSSIGMTETGVKLCNKLFVMNGQHVKVKSARNRITGDICLGNLGWISVHLPAGDDVTVLVFGPRLEDIQYRTPGFTLNVPEYSQIRQRGTSDGISGRMMRFDFEEGVD